MNLPKFYHGKRVFVTGHTGFKGAWLCRVLQLWGAKVYGYALQPPTKPSLFAIAGLSRGMQSEIGDVRDGAHLLQAMQNFQPEVVLHLAAQPIVKEGYAQPAYTYETNVMGTVNVLEAVRQCPCVKSFLNVTTDKVYLNHEWQKGYRESDELDGWDPYSNSKSCSELVTATYRRSFFLQPDGTCTLPITTARAGNVIGGGDFAPNRIVPDCVRAALQNVPIAVRNPNSTRPYQHVLEPVMAYLLLAAAQVEDSALAGSYNVGPADSDSLTTRELAEMFVNAWGEGVQWKSEQMDGPHEANFLKLDCEKLRTALAWQPRWDAEEAIRRVVEWSKAWRSAGMPYENSDEMLRCMDAQIEAFLQA